MPDAVQVVGFGPMTAEGFFCFGGALDLRGS